MNVSTQSQETPLTAPMRFVAVTPCRLVDTRHGPIDVIEPGGVTPAGFPRGSYGDGEVRTYDLTSSTNCTGLPAGIGAWSLQLQFTTATQPAYLEAWPYDAASGLGNQSPPTSESSMLGYTDRWTANSVIVPAGNDGHGSIDVLVQHAGDVIVEINGYYTPGAVVSSLNQLTGAVTLVPGSNVTITPGGNALTISASGGGSLPPGEAGQTLYHDGTTWAANSALTSDGNNVSVGGTLQLPLTTPLVGQLELGGVPFLHAFGAQNTFLGSFAGNFYTTGGENTASGYASLPSVSTGGNNTATGAWSLFSDTTGPNNTAVGYGSLYSNTTGSFNTATGMQSMVFNTTASYNTAYGANALATQSFSNGDSFWNSDNTAIGYAALFSTQSTTDHDGVQNTALGTESLYSNTTGANNTAVGWNAGSAAVGMDAQVPAYDGSSATLVPSTTGSFNTFIGEETGATQQVDNCTAVGYLAYCDGDDQVRLGNAAVTSIGGEVAWSALSDIRAKKDVRDLGSGLELIERLRPVAYTLRSGNGRIDMGFVAQDVERVLGDGYNVVDVGRDRERTLSLRYTELIAPLVKAVQEQEALIETQRGAIAALTARVSQLEADARARPKP